MTYPALATRSDFSLGESTFQVDAIIEKATELGHTAVALVDTMTVSSMVSFSQKATKAGVKPIIGCTLRVYDDPTYRKPKKGETGEVKNNRMFTLKAYVMNDVGLASLIRLLSVANDPEHFYYNSRLGFEEVLATEGLAFSTGDFHSVWHHPDANEIVAKLAARHQVFIELCPIATPLFDRLNRDAMKFVTHAGLSEARIILTYPALYRDAQGADSLDVLRGIATNTKMTEPWLQLPFTRDFFPTDQLTLAHRGVDMFRRIGYSPKLLRDCLANNDALAALCTYEFKKMAPCLPVMAPNEFFALKEMCEAGFRKRLLGEVMGYRPTREQLAKQYLPRLQYELGVIERMDFSGYFLIVADIVNWSKAQGILVGPGRGSVGGSLLAYLIGITDVDPIRFDLLFERFINPDRIDLPDADLDFMSVRRQEVLDYIVAKYGQENVAGVSNYSTLGTASSIRDVARVHGLDPFEYSCSKLVEKEHGQMDTLEESVARVPEIEKYALAHPHLWKHSLNLEGCMRGLGQHAAGVVVGGEPLNRRAVIETRSGGPVVNWDKKYVEEWGLIKMDILGLTTLDLLRLATDYIKTRHGKTIDFLKLPLDDPKVLGNFGKGNTIGVFQFEGPGMRKLLQSLATGGMVTFEDTCATTALYRPGPIDAGLVDQYVAVKQGTATPYYEHPVLESALKATLGVITYQEQVMQVCRDLCGFTMAEADHIRKAMGKKDKVAMAEWRERFIKGAFEVSEFDPRRAEDLWEKIEGFAGYAFNRSHSVEYSIISYYCMWLKTYYPAEFYAAALTVHFDKEDKVAALVSDARANGIQTLPPDINKSSTKVEIEGEDVLRTPFQAIKGISEKSSQAIVDLRNKVARPFTGKADLEAVVTAEKVGMKINSANRDRLERVGAFWDAEGRAGVAPTHPDRLKDRLELMPGFTVEAVKADRALNNESLAINRVIRLMQDTKTCEGCSLKGTPHVNAALGKHPKFMVVFDGPNWQEEKKGQLLVGESADYLKAALKDAGLSVQDGYFTSLVKAMKPKGAKSYTNEQVNGCSEILKKEIETLKPAVILVLGGAATKHFAPGVKNISELVGKTLFNAALDASIVFGINPAQVYFSPDKITVLQQVAKQVAELIH